MHKSRESTDKQQRTKQFNMNYVIELLFGRWTKWELIYIYNFSITNRSIEVRQNLDNGKIQFRTKRIANPVHAQYFDVEDVKKALANVI